jgi:hypothetical protein
MRSGFERVLAQVLGGQPRNDLLRCIKAAEDG